MCLTFELSDCQNCIYLQPACNLTFAAVWQTSVVQGERGIAIVFLGWTPPFMVHLQMAPSCSFCPCFPPLWYQSTFHLTSVKISSLSSVTKTCLIQTMTLPRGKLLSSVLFKYLLSCVGPKVVCGLYLFHIQHRAGGVSHKPAVLCGSFYSWALQSSARAGIVCAWKLICFCCSQCWILGPLIYHLISPSLRRMVLFKSLTPLLGIFTVLLVSFISKEVPSALWAVRVCDLLVSHLTAVARKNKCKRFSLMTWAGEAE